MIPRSRTPKGLVSRAAIRRFASEIATRFRPERIVLFGSYANGAPTQDSDVDILVVMPAADDVTQAVRIRMAVSAPFPVDLLVRTPNELSRRIELGDWFFREIISQGDVLYAAPDQGVDSKGRRRPSRRAQARGRRAATS